MSLHTVLPSTPRQDELVAGVVLGDESPLPRNGNAILYQYAWSAEQEIEVKKEIFSRVFTKVVTFNSITNYDILGKRSQSCGEMGNCKDSKNKTGTGPSDFRRTHDWAR
jgi:hypothetical protein